MSEPSAQSLPVMPTTRAGCESVPRPCAFERCRHHLGKAAKETCALDVAERGGITLEEIGEIMNLTRERIRQIEVKGLNHLVMAMHAAGACDAIEPECPLCKAGVPREVDVEKERQAEREKFEKAIAEHNGSKVAAAHALGITYGTFLRRLDEAGIERERRKAPRRHYSRDDVARALREARGSINQASIALGCSYTVMRRNAIRYGLYEATPRSADE